MNDKQFTTRIKAAMRELLALKTTSVRGLGLFKFYRKTVTFWVPMPDYTSIQDRYWDIAIKIADGEPFPAYVQLELQLIAESYPIGYGEGVRVNNSTQTITYTFRDITGGEFNYTIGVVSPSKIDSVTATARMA